MDRVIAMDERAKPGARIRRTLPLHRKLEQAGSKVRPGARGGREARSKGSLPGDARKNRLGDASAGPSEHPLIGFIEPCGPHGKKTDEFARKRGKDRSKRP